MRVRRERERQAARDDREFARDQARRQEREDMSAMTKRTRRRSPHTTPHPPCRRGGDLIISPVPSGPEVASSDPRDLLMPVDPNVTLLALLSDLSV